MSPPRRSRAAAKERERAAPDSESAPREGRSRRAARTQEPERETSPGPRTGAKRTVVGYIAELPRFLGLLWGLISDRRVAVVDKLLVAGAIAYIVMPLDMMPDFIPFMGEVDDVYLLVVALRRLLRNAGRTVLLSHWSGDPAQLRELNLRQTLLAASFFLPRRVRRRLRVMGR